MTILKNSISKVISLCSNCLILGARVFPELRFVISTRVKKHKSNSIVRVDAGKMIEE